MCLSLPGREEEQFPFPLLCTPSPPPTHVQQEKDKPANQGFKGISLQPSGWVAHVLLGGGRKKPTSFTSAPQLTPEEAAHIWDKAAALVVVDPYQNFVGGMYVRALRRVGSDGMECGWLKAPLVLLSP